jgi:hypothetical protein
MPRLLLPEGLSPALASGPAQESGQQQSLQIPPPIQHSEDEDAAFPEPIENSPRAYDQFPVEVDLEPSQLGNHPAPFWMMHQRSYRRLQPLEDVLGCERVLSLNETHDIIEIGKSNLCPLYGVDLP